MKKTYKHVLTLLMALVVQFTFAQEKPTADDVTRESIADDAETYDG